MKTQFFIKAVLLIIVFIISIISWSCVERDNESNLNKTNSSANPVSPNHGFAAKSVTLNQINPVDTANNVVLTVVKNHQVWGRDRMLSFYISEDAGAQANTPYTDLGQLAYIAGDIVLDPSDLKTLYRAFNNNPTSPDHMETWNRYEVPVPPWTYESYTGEIWDGSKSSPFPGLQPLLRYYNSIGDHDAGFSSDPGYSPEPAPLGWAFPRYGTGVNP